MKSRKASEPADVPLVALVVGREETLREAAVAELRARTLESGPRDFNEDRFDFASGGTQPAQILAALQTLPVMAPRRLVLLRGLDDRRARGFLEGALLEYLAQPVPTTCLVLDAPAVDRRLKWVKQVEKAGRLIDCSGPSRPADVRHWIEQRISAAGKRAGRGTSAALFELVGAELDRLASEVEKVCLFVGERGEVSPDDVAEVTGALRPLAVYELTEAIAERRLGHALGVLSRLMDQGDAPLAVLAALANHFRRLIRAREYRPADATSLQRAFGIHPYAARKLAEQVVRFEPPRLRRCLEAIHSADAALKGASPLAPRLAIERLVLTVAR